jgi:hypothetical protein
MKTTIIKVQETHLENQISYLGIKLENHKTYSTKDKNEPLGRKYYIKHFDLYNSYNEVKSLKYKR